MLEATKPLHQILYVKQRSVHEIDFEWKRPVFMNGQIRGYRIKWEPKTNIYQSVYGFTPFDKTSLIIPTIDPDFNSSNFIHGTEYHFQVSLLIYMMIKL